MVRAVVYTRRDCHLCDEAIALLKRHAIDVTTVDIDEQASLCELYDHCVPVVEIGGKVRFRGRVNEVLLRRLISGENPRNMGV